MAELPLITSLQNPKVKHLVRLRRRRQRDRQRLMLIDGAEPLALALHLNFRIDIIYFVTDKANPDLLHQAQARGVLLQPVAPRVFAKIGYGDNPDGILGLAPPPVCTLERLPHSTTPLYLVAEGLEKPGNLGAILRSADAAGITGLVVCDGRTDLYNPNVIHASRGAFFTVPLAQAPVEQVLDWLAAHQIQILATTPRTGQLYTEVDLRQPSALVVGSEHSGLTAVWLKHTPIRIPMFGQINSLNVAQAASILIFEAVRQRGIENLQKRPIATE